MNIEALKCPCCGGNVDRRRMVCEYCGTQFKKEDHSTTLHIATFAPKIKTLYGRVILPDYMLSDIGSEEAANYATSVLSRSLAEQLKPFMDLEISKNYELMQHQVDARLRIVQPDYRF